jgi:rubredoxin
VRQRDAVSAARDRDAGPGTRMECKVCWYVYDPALGDGHWQIPPGTPWGELPEHWSCPTCAATRDEFLVLADG